MRVGYRMCVNALSWMMCRQKVQMSSPSIGAQQHHQNREGSINLFDGSRETSELRNQVERPRRLARRPCRKPPESAWREVPR